MSLNFLAYTFQHIQDPTLSYCRPELSYKIKDKRNIIYGTIHQTQTVQQIQSHKLHRSSFFKIKLYFTGNNRWHGERRLYVWITSRWSILTCTNTPTQLSSNEMAKEKGRDFQYIYTNNKIPRNSSSCEKSCIMVKDRVFKTDNYCKIMISCFHSFSFFHLFFVL